MVIRKIRTNHLHIIRTFLISIVSLLLIGQGLIIYQNQKDTKGAINIIDEEKQLGYTSGSIINNNNFPSYTHQIIGNQTTNKNIYLKSTNINLNEFIGLATVKGEIIESTRKNIILDVQKIQLGDVIFDGSEYIFLTQEMALNIGLIQGASLITYNTGVAIHFDSAPIMSIETILCATSGETICQLAKEQRSGYQEKNINNYGYTFIKRSNKRYLEHTDKIQEISFLQREEKELLDIIQPLNIGFIVEKYEDDIQEICNEIISVEESSIQITGATVEYREKGLDPLYEESNCNVDIQLLLDTTKKVESSQEETTPNE